MSPTITRFLERMFNCIPRSKFRRWVIFHATLDAWDEPRLLRERKFTLAEIYPDDINLLKKINPCFDTVSAQQRFANGNACHIAWLNGEPVYYVWSITNPGAEPISLLGRVDIRFTLILPPFEAYRWDEFTRSDLRGMGIQPAAFFVFAQQCRERGLRGVLGVVSEANGSKLRAVAKTPYRRIGVVHYVRLLGWFFYF